MKKIISIFCIAFLITLAGCSANSNEGNNTQIPNPTSDITIEDMANELGLKTISIEVENPIKIDGDLIIYSFDSKEYNIRIAKANDTSADISGVYLADNATKAIYDSATEESPTMNVESDDEYSKAYCEWNGYYFSISTDGKQDLDSLQAKAVSLAKDLISKDNIK